MNMEELKKENEKLKNEIECLINEKREALKIIKELETELKYINRRTQCWR
jgi:hypothetical protein